MRLQLSDLQRFAEFLTVRFRAEVTVMAPLPNEGGEYLLAQLADSLLTITASDCSGELRVWSTDSALLSILSVLWLGFRANDLEPDRHQPARSSDSDV